MIQVSVVLPVYNAQQTIARAVGSILDQTLREIELIVIDDGSTDETVAAVREFSDPRLRLIECEHRHVAAAANYGARLVSAPLVARMDADDFAYPRRLEKQLTLLRQENLDVVGCQVRILDQAGLSIPSMDRYQRWINEETLSREQIAAFRFVEFPLVNPTILAKRRYFDLGFRENEMPEDYDLMLRGAAEGMRFGKVEEILLDWTDSPAGLTRSDSRYSVEAFDLCRKTHLLSGPLCNAGQVDLWGVGQTGKPWLRWLQEEGITVRRAYDVNQRKIGQRIHGVLVLDPISMPAADSVPLIIAVGAAGARKLIRTHLLERGYIAGEDAWFVA